MPIYEFRCEACGRRVSIFQRSINAPFNAACPHCGGTNLRRLVSRFAVVRGEDALLDGMDDESLLAGIDENFTIGEALRVLDIIREQQRLQPEPARQPGSGQGLDY